MQTSPREAPPTPAKRIGDEVRAHMAREGKSQANIGTALGLSQTAVSKRLRGEVAFDVTELTKVAKALGVPVAALIPDAVDAEDEATEATEPVAS